MRAKFFGLFFVLALLATLGRVAAVSATTKAEDSQAQQPIIADHTCTDLSQIPEYWIEQAKAQLRLSYGHTSHGSQPVSGMGVLMADLSYGGLYDFNTNGAIEGGVLSLHDREPDGDLGNPDRTTWATRTRNYLDGSGSDRNVVVWSWCGQADTSEENINLYLSLMNDLEGEYPDVTFVYMTGHLEGTGEDGNLNVRNNQIRAYCIANNKVLFDFADIESYDPDGNYYLDRGADDDCSYNGGNWADEWCAAHSGDPLCESCECAHSRPLNCNLKARAFWWMLARLAGWTDATDWISVTAANDVANISPGETATYALSVTASEGFSDPVTLALQGAPSGATVVFDPNPAIPPGTSQLHVTTTASTAPGIYTMTVTSTSGVLNDTANLTLIVASAAPSFTLSISPSTRIAGPNQVVSYTTVVAEANGFSQPVSLTVVGLPTGVGAAWSVNPVTPGNSSILTLSIPGSPSFGNRLLQVVGTADMQVVAEEFELTITYPFRVYLPIILK